jgi:thiamine biosynthesis lipoprotein
LPEPEALDAARACVGLDKVELDGAARNVRFTRSGVELSFGSIGKGYALDRIAPLLRQHGVQRALLSAGGSSVLALGGERGFVVDVRSTRIDVKLARLVLKDAALSTSGAGEQFFEAQGRRYGHVIDPRTGRPAEGVLSASVVASEASVADALSTAFLVGGPSLAERYCAAHEGVLALLTLESEPERLLHFGSRDGVVTGET